MKVFIHCENGEVYGIRRLTPISPLFPFSPVYTIKWMIFRHLKVWTHCQELSVLRGTSEPQRRVVLEKQTNLQHYSIRNESKIFLKLIPPPSWFALYQNRNEDMDKIVFSKFKNDDESKEFDGFIRYSSTDPISEPIKFPSSNQVLDIGIDGPLRVILQFLDSMDLLINVINVNKYFRKIVLHMWDQGLLPHFKEELGASEESKGRLYTLFVLGLADEEIFLMVYKKYFSRSNLYICPRKNADFFGGHWQVSRAFDNDFNYFAERICIDREFPNALRQILELKRSRKLQENRGRVYQNSYGVYLKKCVDCKYKDRKETVDLLLVNFERLLLPSGIFEYMLVKNRDYEGFLKVLKFVKGNPNPVSYRKIIKVFFEAVKLGILKGGVEEWKNVEDCLHEEITLRYFPIPHDPFRFYLPRQSRYVPRQQTQRFGDVVTERVSLIFQSRRIWRFVNYHLHLLEWDLVEYFLKKDFGLGKFGRRKRFRVSRNMMELWGEKELKEFVREVRGKDDTFHNLNEKDLEEMAKKFKKE